jgi:transposase
MKLDFGELWTRKNVREMIRREFRVKLSDVQVGRVLRDIGLSPQKPLYRSYKQNPELVEEWKKVIYPKIRARAAEESAEILFGDEASVRTDHHTGTTWAPVGQTPVARDSGKRQAVKMISAISPRGLVRFQVHLGSMNGDRFIEFLKALIKSVAAEKIFLIVDGSSVHKSKKVKAFLEKDEIRDCLELFFLPGYSPELNPDEWVWNNVKNTRLGRVVSHDRDDLKSKAIGALRRLQSMPHLVRSFFLDPCLSYIIGLRG